MQEASQSCILYWYIFRQFLVLSSQLNIRMSLWVRLCFILVYTLILKSIKALSLNNKGQSFSRKELLFILYQASNRYNLKLLLHKQLAVKYFSQFVVSPKSLFDNLVFLIGLFECLLIIFLQLGGLQQMRKVSYLYNEDITKYELSKEHPMKTKRMKMVHSLINNYSLTPQLKIYHSKQATSQEIASFHHPLYVKYLETWVSPKAENIVQQFTPNGINDEVERAKIREDSKVSSIFKVNQTFDCPGFEGLYNFCKLAAGGSIDAADLLIAGSGDIVINWSGGYHHAKKTEASGFCYVNDIVLCILELLKFYPRVMYLDIDVHHGDGVEQAFYHTNRVMTVSFHEYDQDFFPGTGSLESVGQGHGKFYAVNIPLKKGMDDIAYVQLFKKVMFRIVSSYVPDVMVIQCGADSLSKDKLGHMNLSIKGHGELLTYMKNFNIPMVLLGGGGYTIQNVARCWTYETGLMLGHEIQNQIPKDDAFYNYYGKENNKIHFELDKAQNLNTPEYLNEILETITQNLREADIRPSIAFHNAPRHYLPTEELDWAIIEEQEESMTDEAIEKFFKKM